MTLSDAGINCVNILLEEDPGLFLSLSFATVRNAITVYLWFVKVEGTPTNAPRVHT
jgi:hypothetical protein